MKTSKNDSRELGYAMSRLRNREYLERYIKRPLQETYNRLCDEDGLLLECMDIALLLIFVHIDLLGRLYAGEAYTGNKGTTKNAVIFMERYLGDVDKRYQEVSALLYHTLRHGYVHVFTPKRIQLHNGDGLDFSLSPYHRYTKHLSIRRMKENENVIKRWNIHVSQLFKDLIGAIDVYAEEINFNQDITDKFYKSFVARRIEDSEDKLRLKTSLDYNKGFDYIHSQT